MGAQSLPDDYGYFLFFAACGLGVAILLIAAWRCRSKKR